MTVLCTRSYLCIDANMYCLTLIRENALKKCRQKDYTPSLWSEYFSEKRDVVVDGENTFRVYLSKAPEEPGPLIVLLHGAGFSALTWALFSVCIYIF